MDKRAYNYDMDKCTYYYDKACVKDIRAYIDIVHSKVKLDVEYLVEDDSEKGILAIEGIDITKIIPYDETPATFETKSGLVSGYINTREGGYLDVDFIGYELKSYKVKAMTKSEIERALGYKIVIMEE